MQIRTQLLGKQLLTSTLAAIAGGLAAGLTLAECATGISRVAPVEGRMQPVLAPRGITFIRDDFKAPAWTVEPLLEQLRDACANRKIFILGSISDCESKERGVSKIASKAVQVADITILYGRFAVAGLKARKSSTESKVFAFTRIQDVANLLRSILHDNDLILLKGSEKKDHLSRLALSLTQTVNCWVDDCGRDMFCSECSHLQSHRGPPGLINSASSESDTSATPSDLLPNIAPTDQIIIGLGNPGAEYAWNTAQHRLRKPGRALLFHRKQMGRAFYRLDCRRDNRRPQILAHKSKNPNEPDRPDPQETIGDNEFQCAPMHPHIRRY